MPITLRSGFLVVLSVMGAAACSSTSGNPAGLGGTGGGGVQVGTGGSSGQGGSHAGTSGTVGAVGGAGTGSGGTATGGTMSGGGGSGGVGAGTGGVAGSGGATGGQGGAGGAAGGGGGAGGAGTVGFSKQFTCLDAAGLPQRMEMENMSVCDNFTFRFNYLEGPTWIKSENAFFFSNFNQGDGTTGDIIKYSWMGDCEVWLVDAKTNGLAAHANGQLIGAAHGTRTISQFNLATKEVTVLASMYMGQTLDSPNDLVAHSNGTIYFTNPTYENTGRPGGYGQAVFRIDPMGVLTLIQDVGGQPNGIALSPDETKLYVVGANNWNLDAQGVPTTQAGGGPGGDGINMDCKGDVGSKGTNSAFGGPDGTWLLSVSPPTLTHYNIAGLP